MSGTEEGPSFMVRPSSGKNSLEMPKLVVKNPKPRPIPVFLFAANHSNITKPRLSTALQHSLYAQIKYSVALPSPIAPQPIV